MSTVLLKNAVLMAPQDDLWELRADVLIENGKIAAIEPELDAAGAKVIDLAGQYLAPGFIDAHVHSDHAPNYITADMCGVNRGNTAVIDAGTVGPLRMDEYYQRSTLNSVTRQYVLLNAVSPDSTKPPVLERVKYEYYRDAYEKYSDTIKGLKVTASYSHVGLIGVPLVINAKEICTRLGLPLTVHIGNAPPDPVDFLPYLDRGDVITHSFHNKDACIFYPDGTPKPEAAMARKRGVLFDVGHGRASFSWSMAQAAFNAGFLPDLMGTDLYKPNMNGPVYSLSAVLSKMLTLGRPLRECIDIVTRRTSEVYGLEEHRLCVGAQADLTAFRLVDGKWDLADSVGEVRTVTTLIRPTMAINVSKGALNITETTLGLLD